MDKEVVEKMLERVWSPNHAPVTVDPVQGERVVLRKHELKGKSRLATLAPCQARILAYSLLAAAETIDATRLHRTEKTNQRS